ncbi:MAG: lipoyl domain-containing protein [Desulfurococcales archaeon]|nr:lipoyl domain-containing protein [Desulfurococcales archaeon]
MEGTGNRIVEVRVPDNLWPRRRDWKGRIVSIFKKPGEKVAQGEAIAEVEIEKAIIAIESPSSGIVEEVRVGAGDPVGPGDVIMRLREV